MYITPSSASLYNFFPNNKENGAVYGKPRKTALDFVVFVSNLLIEPNTRIQKSPIHSKKKKKTIKSGNYLGRTAKLCHYMFAVHVIFSNHICCLCIFKMVWPCIFCGTVFVYPQSPYHDSDMIFWLLRIVRGYAFVTSTDPQKFGFESHLRSYCHVHLVDDRSTGSRLLYFLLLLQRADETQLGGNSCPRWLLLAFSLNSIMLPR